MSLLQVHMPAQVRVEHGEVLRSFHDSCCHIHLDERGITRPWSLCNRRVPAGTSKLVRWLQGVEKASSNSQSQMGRSPAASYEAMRAQLLTVAGWALAGSGWAYVLLPRLTLDALFGESGACRDPRFLNRTRATIGHSATCLGICDAASDAPCLRQQVLG